MSSKNHIRCNFSLCSWLFPFVLLLLLEVQSKLQNEEICGNFNGRRMYIELGRKGTIVAENINSASAGNVSQEIESYKPCRFELTTCPACVISVKFTFLNISQHCNKSPTFDSCSCDYVWVYEPPFHDVSGQQFCGHYANNNSLLFYRSQTRTVAIVFFNTRMYEHAFTLQYESEKNRIVVEGSPENENGTQFMSTPFFPLPYAKDFNMEYAIGCKSPKNCRVCLTFTDFLIAKMSVIEFFDWNGRRLNAATGMTFRPPTIISSGPSLNIRFYANGATNRGFKIAYRFLSSDNDNKNLLASKMACGGLVDNLGGGIAMMNVVKEATQFDCVWIVQPSRNFAHFYKHLYVKVVAFSDFDGNTELSIHEGFTSSDTRVELLRYPSSNLDSPSQNQHITPISQGFYLRFKGVLRSESKLGIAYTAFSNNECIPGTDFFCKNQRCIPIYLQCDGFDHCGDNSDEPDSCFQDLKRHSWSHSSNFFFPKTDQYSELHTAAIIFIICCFGMISLVLALIILIFRINGRARRQREVENHLQAIGDLLVLEQDRASVQEEIMQDDNPPSYEAPPNYEEVGNNIFEVSDNLRSSTRRTTRQEVLTSKSFKRGSCTRCSQRLDQLRSQNARMNPKQVAIPNCGVSTSGRSQIPDSPPPAYPQILTETELSNRTEAMRAVFPGTSFGYNTGNGSNNNSNENKQNFLAKHFSNDEFGVLKKKIQHKIKKRNLYWKIEHAKKYFPNFCESDLTHCLSDSEVSEKKSNANIDASEDDYFKMLRSFSLDDM